MRRIDKVSARAVTRACAAGLVACLQSLPALGFLQPARALSQTTTEHRVIPPTFFGMHTNRPHHWPSVPVGALGKGTEMTWPYVERVKGVFDWNLVDEWVEAAEDHHIALFVSPEHVPGWAAANPSSCSVVDTYNGSRVVSCTSMVTDIREWDDYVTAFVMRYKGKIEAYELWNEPDSGFTGTMQNLVTLTTHEYEIIRAIDPLAIILSPSPNGLGPLPDNWFAAGGPRGVDAISFHSYPWNIPHAPESVLTYVAHIRSVAGRYGLSSKPIWDTEGSWGTAQLSSDEQVAAVARLCLLLWSGGVSRFYWYSWDGGNWGSLWDVRDGPHPAARAYGEIYRWMVGSVMNRKCAAGPGTTWTCDFVRPGGYQARAVWNTAGNAPYFPDGKYRRYRDLAGNIVPLSAGAPVTIGIEPILLETLQP